MDRASSKDSSSFWGKFAAAAISVAAVAGAIAYARSTDDKKVKSKSASPSVSRSSPAVDTGPLNGEFGSNSVKKMSKPTRGETNPNAVLKEISAKIIKMNQLDIVKSNRIVDGVRDELSRSFTFIKYTSAQRAFTK